MDPHRKYWNEQHQLFQQALSHGEYGRVREIFLSQHAMVHSARMAPSLWSFEDEVWTGTPDEILRRVPSGEEHSMAWCLWHIARIEDVVLNRLIAGRSQVFERGWQAKLGVADCDTGNAMRATALSSLSAAINLEALRLYRIAVGQRTQEIVRALPDVRFLQKIEPERLRQVAEERLVAQEAREIIDYWAGKTVAGLLAMPPTRHCILHLNEMQKLRQKRS